MSLRRRQTCRQLKSIFMEQKAFSMFVDCVRPLIWFGRTPSADALQLIFNGRESRTPNQFIIIFFFIDIYDHYLVFESSSFFFLITMCFHCVERWHQQHRQQQQYGKRDMKITKSQTKKHAILFIHCWYESYINMIGQFRPIYLIFILLYFVSGMNDIR